MVAHSTFMWDIEDHVLSHNIVENNNLTLVLDIKNKCETACNLTHTFSEPIIGLLKLLVCRTGADDFLNLSSVSFLDACVCYRPVNHCIYGTYNLSREHDGITFH